MELPLRHAHNVGGVRGGAIAKSSEGQDIGILIDLQARSLQGISRRPSSGGRTRSFRSIAAGEFCIAR